MDRSQDSDPNPESFPAKIEFTPTLRRPVHTKKQAYSTLHGPVASGGLETGAEICRSLFDLEAEPVGEFGHDFHSYAGRMHPTIARRAVKALSTPGDLVLDPFCGGGTTLVEALLLGAGHTGLTQAPWQRRCRGCGPGL